MSLISRNFDALLAFLLAIGLVALTTLVVNRNYPSHPTASASHQAKIGLQCQNLPIVVHRPYQCALESREQGKEFETWMQLHGNNYDVVGISHLQRHCSRYTTGSSKGTKELLKLISPKSFIHKIVKQVLAMENDSYGELTPGGFAESLEIGRAFREKFGENFFSNMKSSKDINVGCSPIKRTCDTAKYFLNGAFPEFSPSKNDIPIAQEEYLRQEGKSAIHLKSVTSYEKSILKESNKWLHKSGNLVDNKNLRIQDLKALINILSLNDAQFNTKTFLKAFGKNLPKTFNHFREFERYHKSSIGGCTSCNKTSQTAINAIIKDLEWMIKTEEEYQPKRISLRFTHDNNIIALMDYLGFFAGEQDIPYRNVPMCSNWQILIMKESQTGELRALMLFNEEVKEFYRDDAHNEPRQDSTYSMESLLEILKRRSS